MNVKTKREEGSDNNQQENKKDRNQNQDHQEMPTYNVQWSQTNHKQDKTKSRFEKFKYLQICVNQRYIKQHHGE